MEIVGPLAYQGKEGCQDMRCTRMGIRPRADGSIDLGVCIGWHCAYCDQPCSSQGHQCDAAVTLLTESRRLLDEQRES